MASTGEVACLGENLYEAYLRAWLSTEQVLPKKTILLSIAEAQKSKFLPQIKLLDELGYEFYATSGTHDFLSKNGIGSYFVHKVSERKTSNMQTLISQRKVDLIINIPTTHGINHQSDGFMIRRTAVDHHIPLITNLQIAQIILQCLIDFKGKPPEYVLSWQQYIQRHVHHQPQMRAIA